PASRCSSQKLRTRQWDARIQRANDLASTHAFASQGLRFYERLARFQQSLYAEIETECCTGNEKRLSGTLRGECDFFILLPRFAPFVSVLEEIAPPPLARAAHALRLQDASRWRQILLEFWEPCPAAAILHPAEQLVCWLFL